MHSTQYLYGIDPEELTGMLYFDALQYKYDAGTRLYRKLWLIPKKTEEEQDRMFYVEKAQRHTKALLDERTNID